MESKRSLGITVFAWSVIILNILTLLFLKGWAAYAAFLQRNILIAILLYSIVYVIAGLFAAINALRLKEWARKFLIVLAFLGILDMAVFVPFNHKMIEKTMALIKTDQKIIETIGKQYDKLISEDKIKIIITKDQFINSFFEIIGALGKIINNVSAILFAFYGMAMIWFFTRPKVKAQFKA